MIPVVVVVEVGLGVVVVVVGERNDYAAGDFRYCWWFGRHWFLAGYCIREHIVVGWFVLLVRYGWMAVAHMRGIRLDVGEASVAELAVCVGHLLLQLLWWHIAAHGVG